MPLGTGQRIARLRERTNELSCWIERQAQDLSDWRFEDEPLALGARWPRRDGVVTLSHPEVTVPADWPLEEARLRLDLGGEGLVRVHYCEQQNDAFGHDPNHQQYVLRQRQFTVEAECVARAPLGVPIHDPVLRGARVALVDQTVDALVRLLRLVAETAEQLDGHEVVEPLLTVAERACHRIELPTATDVYLGRVRNTGRMVRIWEAPKDLNPNPPELTDEQHATVAAATESLRAGLSDLQARYPQTGAIALTGHAHIDLAWLWPMDETRRKARRTFASMLDLMDRYPTFLFNQSTAQLYAFLEDDDPALFARIKDKVKSGQWELLGGTWVEMDTNMPCGEAFVRQLLYGQRYFERTFGSRHRVHWLPDCFGFSPALPQLLRLAGIDSFFTIKVNWSETNPMPFDLFWWEGIDGSRVLTHTFNNPDGGYNGQIRPQSLVPTWRNYRGKHLHPESLLSVGFGDGGGGTTEDALLSERDLADFPVVPTLRPALVHDYFARAHEAADRQDLPAWVGEMYLEFHRGTLTAQSRTKYLNRRAERELVTAEVLGAMATMLGEEPTPSLERDWHLLLRNQFHDILPGSSIVEVHRQAEAEMTAAVDAARQQTDRALDRIAARVVTPGNETGLLVINPDLSPRPLRAVSDQEIPGGQRVAAGWVASTPATVAPLTAAVVLDTQAAPGLSVSDSRLENDFVRVDIDAHGTLASVYDKRAGREALDGRGNQIWVYRDRPRVYDAWELEDDTHLQGEELATPTEISVVEDGPHRAAIRVVRQIGESTIQQDIRLWANSPRIDFHTEIDWHDRKLLVKALFPLAIRTDHALYECAFGVHRRPTHRNTSWDAAKFEVAGHRFAELAEQGYGVAVLNDGKYGYHALGNELGLSLLRSPTYPDPTADEGRQTFVYAIFPHAGDWLTAGVLAEAEDLNRPLLTRKVDTARETRWQACDVSGMQLALGALKHAEDGSDLVMRTYEPAGARGRVTIAPADGWRVEQELNLLEDTLGPAELAFRPFQVRTWSIARK